MKTILVVEDDRKLSQAVSIRLRAAGYQVINAFDCVTAMTTARKNDPDLIVLDLALPAGNGIEVAEKLRALPRTASVPIVIATAMKAPDLRERAMEVGVSAFFEKPFRAEEFLAAIEEALSPTPI